MAQQHHLGLPEYTTIEMTRGRSVSTNGSRPNAPTASTSLLKPAHHQVRYARSFDSGLPSLSYASSSGASFSDTSPRMRALSDAFSTDETTWDSSEHNKDQSYDTSKSSDVVLIAPRHLAESRSLNRILNQIASPESSPEPQERPLPDLGRLASIPAAVNHSTSRKQRRIRVESNPALSPPAGFPYRNSANLLSRRYMHGNSSSDRLGHSSSSTRRDSSDNSSDDVDLDLSWEPSGYHADHIGIDMSRLALDGLEDHGEAQFWPTHEPVRFENTNAIPTRTRCRSAGDFRVLPSEISTRSPSRMDESNPQTPTSPFDWSAGWSFNRTSAVDASQQAIINSEAASLRARRRGPVSPLKFFFDKVGRSPNASPAPSPTISVTTMTPGLSDGRPSSRQDLASPTTTATVFTPRSANVEVFDTVDILGNSSNSRSESVGNEISRGEFGAGKAVSNAITYSTYGTARSVPFSLMSAVESDSSAQQTWHTPKAESQDLTELIAPIPERWPSQSNQGLFGLGLQEATYPEDRLEIRPLPPRSPSIGSPSPNSPLLGHPSSPLVPQITFGDDQERFLRAPKSQWATNLRTALGFGSRSDVPTTPRTPSPRRSFSPFYRSEPQLSLVENTSPAKGLFLAAFLLGPWCWLYAAMMLRRDGELYGTRAGLCRCHRKASPGLDLACPADLHRVLRLHGVQSSGLGLLVDMHSVSDKDKLALLNINTDSQYNRFIFASRVMACASGCTVAACFGVAVWAVFISW